MGGSGRRRAGSPVSLTPDAPAHIKAAVLVLEDMAALRRFEGQLSTYRGYCVVQARHGREAIEQLRQQHRAVTVLDVMTPIAIGCEFRVDVLDLTHTQVAAVPVMLRTQDNEAMVATARVDTMAVCKIPFDPEAPLQALA